MNTDIDFLNYLDLRAINSVRDFSGEVPTEVSAEQDTLKLKMSPEISGDTGGMTAARVEYDRKQQEKSQPLPWPESGVRHLRDELNRIGDELNNLFPNSPKEVDPQTSGEAGYGASAGQIASPLDDVASIVGGNNAAQGTFTGTGAQVAGLGDVQLSPESFKPIRKTDAPERFNKTLVDAWQKLKHGTVGAPMQVAEMALLLTAIVPPENIVKNISEEDAKEMQSGLIEAADKFKKIRVGALGADPYDEAQGFLGFVREILTDPTVAAGAGLNAARNAISAGIKKITKPTTQSATAGRLIDDTAVDGQQSLQMLSADTNTSGVAGTALKEPMTTTDAKFALPWGSNKIYVGSRLNGLLKKHQSGKIDSAKFHDEITKLHDELKVRTVTRASNITEPRRGYDNLKAVLNKEAANGRILRESVEIVEWFAKKNPSIVDELAITFDKRMLKEGSAGTYHASEKMAAIRGLEGVARGIAHVDPAKSSTRVAQHEILHHTERLLPEEWRSEIRGLWWDRAGQALVTAAKNNDQEMVTFLRESMSGDTKKAADAMMGMLHSRGASAMDFYQYSNSSEFWAENATNIVRDRATGTFGKKVRSYYTEFADEIKDAVGLDNNNPIYKSLRGLGSLKTKTHGNLLLDGDVPPSPAISRGEKVAAGTAVAVTAVAAASPELNEWRMRKLKEAASGRDK
jgi:hypothetical protein